MLTPGASAARKGAYVPELKRGQKSKNTSPTLI